MEEKYKENTKTNTSHIVIDTLKGNYTLLDGNYKIIDNIHCAPLKKFFFNKFELHKFKTNLKKDLKRYKLYCKKNNLKPSKDFLRIHRKMRFYLWLCPDANANILNLLRNNIKNINSNYKNYQSACYKYLRELAHLRDGDSSKFNFDITLATIDGVSSSNHSYIANVIKRSNHTVHDYIKAHKEEKIVSNYIKKYQNNERKKVTVRKVTKKHKSHDDEER